MFAFNQLSRLGEKFKLILIRRSCAGKSFLSTRGGRRGNFIIALHATFHSLQLVDSRRISLLGSFGNIFGNELLTIAIQFHTQFATKCRRRNVVALVWWWCHRKWQKLSPSAARKNFAAAAAAAFTRLCLASRGC